MSKNVLYRLLYCLEPASFQDIATNCQYYFKQLTLWVITQFSFSLFSPLLLSWWNWICLDKLGKEAVILMQLKGLQITKQNLSWTFYEFLILSHNSSFHVQWSDYTKVYVFGTFHINSTYYLACILHFFMSWLMHSCLSLDLVCTRKTRNYFRCPDCMQ